MVKNMKVRYKNLIDERTKNRLFTDIAVNIRFEIPQYCKVQTSTVKSNNGYKIMRVVKNVSDKTLRLSGLKAVMSGIRFGKDASDDYYYSNENARLFCNMTVPLDYYP